MTSRPILSKVPPN